MARGYMTGSSAGGQTVRHQTLPDNTTNKWSTADIWKEELCTVVTEETRSEVLDGQ